MRIVRAFVIGLVLLISVACSSSPVAPTSPATAQLTIMTNAPSVIAVSAPNIASQGNINVLRVTATVPTSVSVQVDVIRMDGNGRKDAIMTVMHDTTMHVDF